MRFVPLSSSLLELLQLSALVGDAGLPTESCICRPVVRIQDDGSYVMSLCVDRYLSLAQKRIPPLALLNNRWLGDIPFCLIGLTFMEKI